jgi:hypothetical protein
VPGDIDGADGEPGAVLFRRKAGDDGCGERDGNKRYGQHADRRSWQRDRQSFNGDRVAGPSVLVRHGAYVRVALGGVLGVPTADILVEGPRGVAAASHRLPGGSIARRSRTESVFAPAGSRRRCYRLRVSIIYTPRRNCDRPNSIRAVNLVDRLPDAALF